MSVKMLAASAVADIQATHAAAAPPPATPAAAPAPGPAPLPAVGAPNAAAIDSALSALLEYIPTEVTAIYLAVSSAQPAIAEALPSFDAKYVFWGFVFGITPLLFVLLFYNQLARQNLDFPSPKDFPWFRLAAAVIAFTSWALCIPKNPYAKEPGIGVLFGVVAVIVALVLPLTETIVNRRARR